MGQVDERDTIDPSVPRRILLRGGHDEIPLVRWAAPVTVRLRDGGRSTNATGHSRNECVQASIWSGFGAESGRSERNDLAERGRDGGMLEANGRKLVDVAEGIVRSLPARAIHTVAAMLGASLSAGGMGNRSRASRPRPAIVSGTA